MNGPTQSNDRSPREAVGSSASAADLHHSKAPGVVHTTGHPSDIPKAGRGALTAWIVVPILIVLLLLAGMFMIPGMGANTEDKDPPRRSNDSEQSAPE